jgi:NADH-quinone oxidoreductase subunit C
MQNLEILKDFLITSKYSQFINEINIKNGEVFIIVESNRTKALIQFLKNNESFPFQLLVDLCCVDNLGAEKRYQIVYNLLSLTKNLRITVKTDLDEQNNIETISDIYSAANWYEREAWDMYGILFIGHPDLRRILTDYGFEGHPMRKDFPLTGFVEVRYDSEEKKVLYEKVKLVQDFRNFNFNSPWQGTEYILPGDEKATKE